MKIAITGGTGFIGRHLARDLAGRGHEVVLIARGHDSRDLGVRSTPNVKYVQANVLDTAALAQAFAGCAAVVHCAGTSGEDRTQTLDQVHVEGTRSLVAAARQAGVGRVVLVSFLRARPGMRSRYHTSKWEGEQILRASGLNFTILKAGLVYGPGDHMLDRLGQLLKVLPFFVTVGLREQPLRPLAVQDLVPVMRAAALDDRLANQSLAVVGPELLTMSEVARRVSRTMGKRSLLILPVPVFAQQLLGWFSERLMPTPLVTSAQIAMLADGIAEPLSDGQPLPGDLEPQTSLTDEQIRLGLPA